MVLFRGLLSAAEMANLKEAARQIFGNLPMSPHRSGNKVLRKHLAGERMTTYYSKDINRVAKTLWYDYKTDKDINREERLVRAYARGNPPTRKGQGKRASQKKK